MSSLVVQVTTIDEIKPHSNADRLEIAIIGGWQCVVAKGQYQAGAHIVYFPPETVLPQSWTDRFGVTQYCSLVKSVSPTYSSDEPRNRIRCARLRGEPSFGLVVTPELAWPVGTDVAAFYGALKYEPPVKFKAEDATPAHPLFAQYTSIENLRHFPTVLNGMEVVVVEKLHGTNTRVGLIEGTFMAGSHRVQRKEPTDYAANRYWFPLSLPGVKNLLTELGKQYRQVVLYGEVFGRGIQAFTYGRPGLAYAAFDLLRDGTFADYDLFMKTCEHFGVPVAPELGQFSYDSRDLSFLKELVAGISTYGGNIKEGAVLRPLREQSNPQLGRLILKYLADDYLLAKHEDFTDR